MTPVHEHDCDHCVYIASYPLRHPRKDEWNERIITHADIYHTCEEGKSFYKFIVRYGVMGEYATTNVPSRYCLVPWVDGVDDYAEPERWWLTIDTGDELLLEPLDEDIFS